MKVHVVDPSELPDAQVAAWAGFQAADPALASPFLSSQFATTVAQWRPGAAVAVAEDRAGLLGFLGFECNNGVTGVPIGGMISDANAFVGRPGSTWSARELIRRVGLRSWRFDHLVAEQEPFVRYHHSLHASPVIDLASGFDRYLDEVKEQSKSFLAQVGRRRRRLEREVGPVTFEWDSTRADDLPALMEWKSAQYQRTDAIDLFAEDWARNVVRDLARRDDVECRGVLSVLRSAEHTIAVHFGLRSSTVLSWWFPTYDPEFGQYSPGLILLMDLAEEAAKRGITTLDLGRGDASYKTRAANASYQVAEGFVPAVGKLRRGLQRVGAKRA